MIKLQILLVFYSLKNYIEAKSKRKWYYSKLPSQIAMGFTLAEVLITLLIIGIVASLVIPALIQDSQKAEIKTSWKKAYGVASQAYKLAIIDNGGSFGPYHHNSELSPKWNAMIPHMNIVKSCVGNTLGNCWAPNGVTQQDGTYYTLAGCAAFGRSPQNSTYAYVTADGMYWLVLGWGPADTFDLVSVDVNGAKGPNIFGKDVFSFIITESKIEISTGCGVSAESFNYLKGD